jgi:hypothetical protein
MRLAVDAAQHVQRYPASGYKHTKIPLTTTQEPLSSTMSSSTSPLQSELATPTTSETSFSSASQGHIGHASKILVKECLKRGTLLSIMPQGMSRRKQNTSYYDKR